jgi:hypothetical protein
MNTEIEITDEPIKLPEWKACYEDMMEDGVDYGKTYTAEFFESRLRTTRDTLKFGLDVSNVRTKLLEHGYYLSGRGGKGEQFVILEAAANSKVMENFQFAAANALKKGVILGTNTRVDILTDEERRKHESMLEKLAIRAALFGRRMPTLRKAMQTLPQRQTPATA